MYDLMPYASAQSPAGPGPDRSRPGSALRVDPRRMPAWAADTDGVSADTATRLLRPADPGRALDEPLRVDAERAFGRRFSAVRVHDDAESRSAVDGIDAQAASHGWDVMLGSAAPRAGTPQYRGLLWHELTHVAQQAGVARAPGGRLLSDPHGAHEARADSVAHGRLPGSGVAAADPTAALVHRQGRHAVSSADPQSIEEAMDAAAASAAGQVGLHLLQGYAVEDTVDLAIQLDRDHRLETIAGAVATDDTSPLVGVLFAVLYLSPNHRATPSWGVLASFVLGRLPATQRTALLESVLRASGRGDEIAALQEGAAAVEESETTLAATPEREVDASAANVPPTMGGMVPGGWNPGRQPIPFYLGNAAHVGIAATYLAAHVGDATFTNVVSVATILAAARRLGLSIGASGASRGQLAMEPDIANLTRLHLYEIKPSTLQTLGRTEAALYVAAFAAAGLPIGLGPMGEPGTSGIIPAPGGWYEFRAPESGVITYNYRQPPRVRVRRTSEASEPEPVRSKSLRQRVAEITGLSGAALTVYLIISEGSRIAFPPRNFVPVP